MTGDRAAFIAYRAMVRLYPREFREEYGADMVQLLRDQRADEPAWRVFARAAIDVAITVPAQHLEVNMNEPSTHLVPLLYTACALGGVLLAIVGGSSTGVVALGVIIAVVAGTTAAIAWRRTGPAGGRISTRGWWKLVVAGPCIIAGVVAAAGIGIDAWMVGMFAVLVAFVVTGLGVILGIVRLVQQRSPVIRT